MIDLGPAYRMMRVRCLFVSQSDECSTLRVLRLQPPLSMLPVISYASQFTEALASCRRDHYKVYLQQLASNYINKAAILAERLRSYPETGRSLNKAMNETSF